MHAIDVCKCRQQRKRVNATPPNHAAALFSMRRAQEYVPDQQFHAEFAAKANNA